MKVVGKEIKIYRAVCPYCSAIIEFEKEDIKKGCVPYFNKLQCPICEKIGYVGNPEKRSGDKTNLQLIMAQYNPEASTWKSDPIELKVGMNEIDVPTVKGFTLAVETGGSLYINYTGNNPNEVYGVRVVGGDEIPMLDFVRDENGNYYQNEEQKKAAVKKYIVELEGRITNLEELHKAKHDGNKAQE